MEGRRIRAPIIPAFKYAQFITRRILSIPPAPAFFDQRLSDVGAIGQAHIGQCTPVLVLPVGLECYFFAKDQR